MHRINEQRKILDELLNEYALIILRDGEIIFQSKKHTLTPLIDAIETLNKGANNLIIGDRVVGKAAALLMINLEPKYVYARILSIHARKVFDRCNIMYEYGKIVEMIKTKSGDMCPFERLVLDIDDPKEALRIIKEKIRAKKI